MYATLFPYLLGLLLAAATIYPARALGTRERSYWTVIIAVVVVGFIGFPVFDGDAVGVRWELGALLALLAVVAAGRWWPLALPLAFLGHGAWDLAHLLGAVPVDKPRWVVELCVPYDWTVATYLFVRRGGVAVTANGD